MRRLKIFCVFFIFVSSCKTVRPDSSNLASSSYESLANAANIIDKSKPFHKYMWLTAHNAFARPGKVGIFNQTLSIEKQLKNGVRGLMLDVYKHGDKVVLCHGHCIGRETKFSEALKDISSFLKQNSEAVIMVNLEEYVNHEQMQSAFNESPDFAQYVFNPKKWPNRTEWPTLQEMIDKNQRLLLLVQHKEQSTNHKDYDNDVYVFHDWDITSENVYNLKNKQCHSRWDQDSHAMDRIESVDKHALKWTRLFVMNHFHASPNLGHVSHDNAWDSIPPRVENECFQAAKRRPNYIAVDFVEEGDVIEYIEFMNNGGIIAYDKENTKSVQCGFSTAFKRTFLLNDFRDGLRLGCENDQIKAIKLMGMKAGQRVTFYDNVPEKDREKAKAVLTIKQDIAFDQPIVIMNLDASVDTPHYNLVRSGKKVDGKVSVVQIDSGH